MPADPHPRNAAPAEPLRRSLLAASLLLLGAGCPHPPVARPYPPPSAEELAARLDAQLGRLGTLRSEAKVDYLADKGDRIKVKMTFVVRPPGSLRVEAAGPLGGSVASLATGGSRFQLLDVRGNRLLAGAASACNIARLLRVGLTPADVVAVVGGSVPRLDGPATSEVGWDGEGSGHDLLTLKSPDGRTEVIRFTPNGEGGDIAGAELRAPDGKVVWSITHADFADAGGARLPEKTDIAQPARQADARIRWKSREVKADVPDTVFHLDPHPESPSKK